MSCSAWTPGPLVFLVPYIVMREMDNPYRRKLSINCNLLCPLRKCVVKPVLDTLSMYPCLTLRSTTLSTIDSRESVAHFLVSEWAAHFFPIHVAGSFDSHHSRLGHKVSDFVISSYVPTLSVVLPSREALVSHDDLHVLVVRQSDGVSQLPGEGWVGTHQDYRQWYSFNANNPHAFNLQNG